MSEYTASLRMAMSVLESTTVVRTEIRQISMKSYAGVPVPNRMNFINFADPSDFLQGQPSGQNFYFSNTLVYEPRLA